MAYSLTTVFSDLTATSVVAVIRKLSAGVEGDYWDDVSQGWVASPSASAEEISLSAGTGYLQTQYTGATSADLAGYTGRIRIYYIATVSAVESAYEYVDADVRSGVTEDPDLFANVASSYTGVEEGKEAAFILSVYDSASGAGDTSAVTSTEIAPVASGVVGAFTATTNSGSYSGARGLYTVTLTSTELVAPGPYVVRITTANSWVGEAYLVMGERDVESDWADGGRLDIILDAVKTSVDQITGTDLPAISTQIDSVPSAAETADAVWDEAISGHTITGTAGDLVERLDIVATGGAGQLTPTRAANLSNLDEAVSTKATPNDVQTEARDALQYYHLDHLLSATYDSGNPPGASTSLLNAMVTDDVGTPQWSANALELSPSGYTLDEIADAVWDEPTLTHTAGGTFGYLATWAASSNSAALEVQGDWTAGGRLDTVLAAAATSIEVSGLNDISITDVQSALALEGLDKLVASAVSAGDVADGSIVANLAATSGIWGDFLSATDSLQSIKDQGDASWRTAEGFSTHSAADVVSAMDSSSISVAAILADTNELQADWADGGRLDSLLDSTSTHSAADVVTAIDATSTSVADILADTNELQGNLSTTGTLGSTILNAYALQGQDSVVLGRVDVTLTTGGEIHTMIGNISATPNVLSPEFVATSRTFEFEPDQPRSRNVLTLAPGDEVTLSGDFSRTVNPDTSLGIPSAVVVVEGDAADLTIGTAERSQDGLKVHCKISGWQAGKRYVIRFSSTTTDADTISGDGVIKVR